MLAFSGCVDHMGTMMRAAGVDERPTTKLTSGRQPGRRVTILSVLAMVVAALAVFGAPAPAQAVQAPGDDVPIYQTGWSWTYQTTFTYNDGAGTNATLNENVTYTVAGIETFAGQDAYRLNISGSITGGNGSVSGDISADLDTFSGSVSGTRFVRRSDLALLQENQQQHLNAKAHVSFITVNVTADINLSLTPNPGWRTAVFPLNGGDSWHSRTDVSYTGGFSYDAGSVGGSGSDTFDGVIPFDATASVTAGNVAVPIGTVPSKNIVANSNEGTVDNHWWSPQYKADARHFMSLPLDGATATIDRRLSAANTPAPGTSATETITPSLTCAGGTSTVTGKIGNAAGVPVSVSIDKSPINPGQKVTVNTTTTAGGNYSADITAPSESDGMAKNGSRANWGVLVSGGGANQVATLVVTPTNCSSIDYTGPNSGQTGTSATVTAKLTDLTGASAAGRMVTFALSGGGSVNASTNASGIASATLPITGAPRSATITASWAGNAGLAAASTSEAFEVGKITTDTVVLASPSEVEIGSPVVFTATVTPDHGANPGGTVQFLVNGNNFGAAVPLTGDTATSSSLDSSLLGLGDHTVTAVYSGDATFGTSTSPTVTFKVRPVRVATSTTSSVTPSSSTYGDNVTLSASVTASDAGTPTGTVTFTRGATTLATAPVDGSGNASVVISTLPVGGYNIVASYSGDDAYNGSAASPKPVTVAKAATTVDLSSADDTTVSGESVTFSATVSGNAGGGTPTGTVQLEVDGNPVGAPVALSGGTASFPAVDSLLAGDHTVSATYSGNDGYLGNEDSLVQHVSKAQTETVVNVSPSPSNEGQNVTITALVSPVAPGSGSPTGNVSFTANGDAIGAAPLQSTGNGMTATLDIADLPPGSYSIVATYAGDSSYIGGDANPVSHTVIEGAAIVGTTTALFSSQNPSTYGELISFTANVAADDGTTPSGAVQFSVDGVDFGSPVPVVDGVAESAMLASPEPGDHTVIAAFVPNPGYASSGWFLTQTVADADVDLTLTSSAPSAGYGDAVTWTAQVTSTEVGTGSPSGFVQFQVDGLPLGDAVALNGSGAATSPSVNDLAPGDHTITALYSGDGFYLPESTTYMQSVAKIATTTSLALSQTATTFGQPVTLTATVAAGQPGLGAPNGTVTFKDGSTTLGTVAVTPGSGASGTAALTVSNLGAGSHSIKAFYSGSPSFSASESGAKSVTVGKLATSLYAEAALVKLSPLGLPLGRLKVTLSSAQGPVANAPIQFKIGPNTVCVSNTDAQGVATCNALPQLLQLTLALGYTATYAGDADHLGSTDRGGIIK